MRWRAFSTMALVLGIFLALMPEPGLAQKNLPDELQRSLDLLDQQMYEQALMEAENFIRDEPDDRYTAAALVIAGRCEVNLGRGRKALERGYLALDLFGDNNPMAAQTFYLIATANQELGDSYEAARALVRCLDSDPDQELRTLVMDHLAELFNGPIAYRAENLKLLARKHTTRDVLEVMLPKSASIPTFGLLVPESDNPDDPGRQIIDGFQAALEKWRAEQGIEAEVVIRRVPKGGPYAVHAARTLSRVNGVWGMVVGGPEEMVVPAVVESQAAGVPVILPAQRRPGLDALGPDVLLPEADWHREGRIAAIYAADSLGLKTFGIVAPYTDQGRELVSGFLEVLDERDSVEVLAQEWYFPEEGVSLARQFQRLRTIGFRREFLDSLRTYDLLPSPETLIGTLDTLELENKITLLDSLHFDPEAFKGLLAPVDSADTMQASIVHYQLDSLFSMVDSIRFERMWVTHLDSIKRTIEFKTGKIDSNDIELNVFDALYLPIDPGTIPLFAPQFAFYAFNTSMFGNAAWYNPDELYRNRQYVENLIFTAPYRLEATDGEMGELMMYLQRVGGGSVTPWNIRGYDAGNILLEMVASGRSGPGDIAEGLHHLDSLSLAAGAQTFSEGSQVAQNMWLLTARNGIVEAEDAAARRLMLSPIELDSLATDSTTVDSLMMDGEGVRP